VVTFDSPIPGPAKPADLKSAAATPATPTDKYGFRLNVASATNPDEDFTQSSIIRVELPNLKLVLPKKPFPKWIFIPIAAGIVLLLLFLLRLFI
jgi:hypothetical protein